jgi:N6-L-threonylcarbamoyladenine synthase
MTRLAVKPVQSQVLIEFLQAEKPLERRLIHLSYIRKAHVVGDQREDLLRLVIGKAQTTANLLRNTYPGFHVSVEAYTVGRYTKSSWFAHIVQQSGPSQRGRAICRQPSKQHQGVYPNIALRVVLRGLLYALHSDHFRKYLGQKPGRIQQFECATSSALCEHQSQFVPHSLATNLVHERRKLLDGSLGGRLQFKCETRSKTGTSQHAQLVFGKALPGVTDRAYHAEFQVSSSTDEIQNRVVDWVQHHAVDSEVPALHILFRAGCKSHRIRMSAVGVGPVTAKRRHLSDDFASRDQHDAEVGSYGKSLLKQNQNLTRQSAGGDVKVLRLAAHQQVADAAPDEVGLVPGASKPGDDLRCRLPRCIRSHTYYYRKVSQTNGLILAIESSCDETAAAVVERGHRILSNIVASQIAIHAPYGGVVPELASREHLRNIVPVVRAALDKAGVGFRDLDAIAVTEGPGLAGALLVGVAYAKSLAFALNKPLLAVNHLEGHIHAVLMAHSEPGKARSLALVVSGGHTHLYLIEQGSYRNVGATLDDAAGEAFDKVAKLLGLGYPGGPWIDTLAAHGDPAAVAFSLTQVKQKVHRPDTPVARFAFSFSGIKTAVLRFVQIHDLYPSIERRREALAAIPMAEPKDALALCDARTLGLIASFQRAVVEDLKRKTFQAAEALGAESVLVSGGVAANRELRARFTGEADRRGLPIAFPTVALSTDNAAMIAAAAWQKYLAGRFAALDLTADASLALGTK